MSLRPALYSDYPGLRCWTFDDRGRVRTVDAGTLAFVGLTPADIPGWDWRWAIHPADQPAVRRAWQRAAATAAPVPAHFRLRGVDGQYHEHVGHLVTRPEAARAPVVWYGTPAAVGLSQNRAAGHIGGGPVGGIVRGELVAAIG